MAIYFMRTYYIDDSLLGEQISAIYSFGRSVVYFKQIEVVKSRLGDGLRHFWVHTANSYLMLGIMEWCHVLGNDCRSKIHWHNIAPRSGVSADGHTINNDNFRSEVRTALKSQYNWSNSELNRFVKSMVAFRNKYVAHRDIGEYVPVPFLDKAYVVANAYLEWLQNELVWNGPPQKTLVEIEPEFLAEAQEGLGHLDG